MGKMTGTITYKGSPEQKGREFNKFLKTALQAGAESWHEETLPKHFEPKAKYAYRYAPRGKKYRASKLRKHGHELDLVLTGRLKREVTRMARVRGTRKRATVSMRAPAYLYMYNKKGRVTDKAAELVAVSKKELLALAQNLKRRMTDRLNAHNPVETKKV